MLEQERRTGIDRRQGRGAALRKPPFLTSGGIIYGDRRMQIDRRLIHPVVTLIRNPDHQ